MGRIKTTQIKRAGNELVKTNGDKFKEDFEINKQIISELTEIPSKKIRNIVAGYVTRLTKQQNQTKRR
jgi:small subunit ribosomal protein S17e